MKTVGSEIGSVLRKRVTRLKPLLVMMPPLRMVMVLITRRPLRLAWQDRSLVLLLAVPPLPLVLDPPDVVPMAPLGLATPMREENVHRVQIPTPGVGPPTLVTVVPPTLNVVPSEVMAVKKAPVYKVQLPPRLHPPFSFPPPVLLGRPEPRPLPPELEELQVRRTVMMVTGVRLAPLLPGEGQLRPFELVDVQPEEPNKRVVEKRIARIIEHKRAVGASMAAVSLRNPVAVLDGVVKTGVKKKSLQLPRDGGVALINLMVVNLFQLRD